jgi:hypothetical protein
MTSFKSIAKIFVLVGSGIAIVVVGGFMMGAVAKLWLLKNKKIKNQPNQNSNNPEKNKTNQGN